MPALAHMGGIPELLTVVVPLALVIVLLRVGAKRMPDPPPDDPADPADPAEPDPPG